MKVPNPPVLYVKAPLMQRIRMNIMLGLIKVGFACITLFYARWRTLRVSADKKPTFKKRYAPLPQHDAHVFIPPTYKSGDAPLPLIIDIHGGGYTFGAPWIDDFDNGILCHTHGFCVVSIDYRTGPVYKFPTAARDCAAMISAVLADETLPIDLNKVALVGYSAGGNMILTAYQILPEADKQKIKAAVAIYPSVDQVPNSKEKIARQTLPKGVSDILHSIIPLAGYAYIAVGQNRADPLLSPMYAERSKLPPCISIVACEYDVLEYEAREMAEDLASSEKGDKVPLGGGRNGWTKGRVRWEVIEKVGHSFNQRFQDEPKMVALTRRMHSDSVDWLNKVAFA